MSGGVYSRHILHSHAPPMFATIYARAAHAAQVGDTVEVQLESAQWGSSGYGGGSWGGSSRSRSATAQRSGTRTVRVTLADRDKMQWGGE